MALATRLEAGFGFKLQTPRTNPSRSATAITAFGERFTDKLAAWLMTVRTSFEVICARAAGRRVSAMSRKLAANHRLIVKILSKHREVTRIFVTIICDQC